MEEQLLEVIKAVAKQNGQSERQTAEVLLQEFKASADDSERRVGRLHELFSTIPIYPEEFRWHERARDSERATVGMLERFIDEGLI